MLNLYNQWVRKAQGKLVASHGRKKLDRMLARLPMPAVIKDGVVMFECQRASGVYRLL